MTVNEIAAKLNEIVDWINSQSGEESLRQRVQLLNDYRVSDNSRVSARLNEIEADIEMLKSEGRPSFLPGLTVGDVMEGIERVSGDSSGDGGKD
jgi:hypothetical protein